MKGPSAFEEYGISGTSTESMLWTRRQQEASTLEGEIGLNEAIIEVNGIDADEETGKIGLRQR